MRSNTETKPEAELVTLPRELESVPVLPEKAFDVESFKKSIKNWEVIRDASLALLRTVDVMNIGGHPYIPAKSSEVLANPLGVSIVRWTKPEKQHLDGGHYRWIYRGLAFSSLTNRYMWVEGTASSRDKFFAKVGDTWKEVEEIDEANIMAKARRNVLREAVRCLNGLGALTWDDLKKHGVDKEKAAIVEFKDEGKKRKDIADWIFEMAGKDEGQAKKMLEGFTEFDGKDGKVKGIVDVRYLKAKRLQVTHQKVQREYKQFKEEGKPPDTGQESLPME